MLIDLALASCKYFYDIWIWRRAEPKRRWKINNCELSNDKWNNGSFDRTYVYGLEWRPD